MDYFFNIIVPAICAIIGAVGGVSIFTLKQQRQLKNIEVTHNQADEWQRLYEEADGERKKLNDKVDELYKERTSLSQELSTLKLRVQQLQWYHCTVENCKLRKPPHVFDVNGTEITQTAQV